MSVCMECGFIIYSEDKYCGGCGTVLPSVKQQAMATQQELTMEDVRFNLASVYFKMGKNEKAKEELDKVLADNPRDQQALNLLKQIKEK
ncbi:MAG: tetratricopeptide repeat protein [Caldithrix sp.]|nr:tetratricopeptide repeat protein [Caldithrix sp.]